MATLITKRVTRLLNAVTAVGAGDSFRLPGDAAANNHIVQVLMGGETVATAVTVDLEGSIDDKNWFQLARHVLTAAEITAEKAMFTVVDFPVLLVKVNLITLTGGTNPTITADYVSK